MLGSIVEAPFKEGDHVVYRPHGVAKIVGRALQGSADCFALELASGVRAFIPIERAATALRPLATPEEAQSDLEILRQEGVDADTRFYKARQEDRDRIMRSGTRVEIVELLRRLYAKTPASEADGRAIRAIEDLVLGEIAIVLNLTRAGLESEMRGRYPVFRDRRNKDG